MRMEWKENERNAVARITDNIHTHSVFIFLLPTIANSLPSRFQTIEKRETHWNIVINCCWTWPELHAFYYSYYSAQSKKKGVSVGKGVNLLTCRYSIDCCLYSRKCRALRFHFTWHWHSTVQKRVLKSNFMFASALECIKSIMNRKTAFVLIFSILFCDEVRSLDSNGGYLSVCCGATL